MGAPRMRTKRRTRDEVGWTSIKLEGELFHLKLSSVEEDLRKKELV